MYCDTHNLTQVSLKPGSSYLMCVCSSADALMFYIHGIFEQHQTSCCTVKNQWAPPLETPLLEQSCSLTQALKSRCFMYSFFSFLWKKLARSHKMYSQSLMDLRKRQDHWPSWGKVNFTTTVRHTAFEMILSDLQPPHLLVISVPHLSGVCYSTPCWPPWAADEWELSSSLLLLISGQHPLTSLLTWFMVLTFSFSVPPICFTATADVGSARQKRLKYGTGIIHTCFLFFSSFFGSNACLIHVLLGGGCTRNQERVLWCLCNTCFQYCKVN